MTGPRRRLRTRLLVAMVAVALGTLVVTAAITAGLARDAAIDSARDDLDARGKVVADELNQLIERLPEARAAAQTTPGRRQVLRIRNLVNASLDASDGAVVGIDTNDDVHEVLGSLLGVDQTAVATLPNGVSVDDLDVAGLRDGHTQEGRAGSTVFNATPLDTLNNGTVPVLVLADDVNTRPFGAAGGVVLGAALLALVVAAAVAAYLARRLTRPIAAMETTARTIAGGDLSARVDETHVRDDELGSLAHAINGMAQELEESQGHERAFLLSVSHDLRTPLTSIRGYAEAIADGTVEGADARIRAAGVISSESRRLERLVADLLDLARVATRQFSLEPQLVDVQEAVAGAVEAFQPSAAEIGVVLEMRAGPAVSTQLDPQRLAQIVANLVENALKFATTRVEAGVNAIDGGVEIHVDD